MSSMEALIEMEAELDSAKLEVQLAPLNPRLRNYNEGGCKRVVTSRPVKWYRELCNRHVSSRGVRRGKFDTRIKRANVLRLLSRLSSGLPSCSKYAAEIRGIAERRAG